MIRAIFTPLFLSPLLSFFSYPSNIEIIFDDVNEIDRPNATPTVCAICTFAVYFLVFQPFFVASLLFVKGISYCVIRRKLEPFDRAKANFKRP